MAKGDETPAVTIKKYANRRLYNTATSSYVTLENLAQMVKDGVDFTVVDARSGEDITRAVLTQIIFEEENKGTNLLPIGFLRQLIGFYGDSLQTLVPRYLDHSMKAFAENQDAMRRHFSGAMTGMFSPGNWDEISKQNMAVFERAMQMWSAPFAPKPAAEPPAESGESNPSPGSDEFDDLRRKLEALQKQVNDISRDKKDG